MKKLSIGQPSTLGSYHDNCVTVFGENSKPAKFFQDKIEKSPQRS